MKLDTQAIINEINAIEGDVLVSISDSGEAMWGEVMALPADVMEQEMESIGYTTDGMLTGEEFIDIYA